VLLLWHGSPIMNFCGIISQGLRIAPAEAPMSGYMFGKGVYFADCFAKSHGYCRGGDLLFLCEVIVGDPCELESSEYMEKPKQGYNSTKGVGRTAPDENEMFYTQQGVGVPIGNLKNKQSAYLTYNEFIVYDVKSVIIRYIVQLEQVSQY